MQEIINTQSVARGFVQPEDIVLCTSRRTRTIFRAGIHSGGVRGHIIRQKIGQNGSWKDLNEVNFNSVPADCGIKVELDTDATRTLYIKLAQLYGLQEHGIESGAQKYIIGTEDEVLIINDQNQAKIIAKLLEQGRSEEFWRTLSNSDPDLASRLALAKVQFDRQEAIREYESSLVSHLDNEGYWQNFFQRHPWMLQSAFSSPVIMLDGEAYLGGKMPIGRQGKGGVATDFLFSDDTTKSFAVVEIKTPSAHLVGAQYRGADTSGYDNEIYAMHGDLSGGVVQTRNQIAVAVEHFQSVLGPAYEGKLNRVHPKGILILGSTVTLSQRKKDSFNQFRNTLNSLTVITFDELLHRLKLLFDMETITKTGSQARGA